MGCVLLRHKQARPTLVVLSFPRFSLMLPHKARRSILFCRKSGSSTPMICLQTGGLRENNGNHENDEGDSDSHKLYQGVTDGVFQTVFFRVVHSECGQNHEGRGHQNDSKHGCFQAFSSSSTRNCSLRKPGSEI